MANEGEFPKTDGDILYGSEANKFYSNTYFAGLNTIRQLQDRAITFSKGLQEGWGEAYNDADGRLNSVVTASSTAEWNTDNYRVPNTTYVAYVDIYASTVNTATLSNGTNNIVCFQLASGIWRVQCAKLADVQANMSYIWDIMFYGVSNGATNPNGTTGLTELRCSISTWRNLKMTYYRAQRNTFGSSIDVDWAISPSDTIYYHNFINTSNSPLSTPYLQIPTGTNKWTGTSINNVGTSTYYTGTGTTAKHHNEQNNLNPPFLLNSGLVFYTNTTTATPTISGGMTSQEVATFTWSNTAPDTATYPLTFIISHTIPTGTFSSTIRESVGVAHVKSWETGADIKYKFQNTTEDSGWLDCGVTPTVDSFTAFTSEPTKLIVALYPKTSPTTNYPAIYGFWVRAES